MIGESLRVHVGGRTEDWRHTSLSCPLCSAPSLYVKLRQRELAIDGNEEGARLHACGKCGHHVLIAVPDPDPLQLQRIAQLRPQDSVAKTPGGTGALTLPR